MRLLRAVILAHRRFMSLEKKVVRRRIESYDTLSSREKHVRRAMYLKDMIIQRPEQAISMYDLREECDKLGIFSRKLYYLLEFYKTIFQTRVDRRRMEWVQLGPDGHKLLELERRLMEEHEPVIVENLRKLLMMSSKETISLRKIALCREFLGLPLDFESSIVYKYPQYFQVVIARDRTFSESLPSLKLTSWDPLLAVPRRESDAEESGLPPFSFRMHFHGCKGIKHKEQLFWDQFQALSFPSPYDPGHAFPSHSREAVKRAVAVAHEFLCLTQEKRAYIDCLQMLRRELGLPKMVEALLCRYFGIFYMSKHCSFIRFPRRMMVFLKEGYSYQTVQCAKLIYKGPLVQLKEAYSETMYFLDKAYDRKHGTNSLNEGRPFPVVPYEAFEYTFQSDKYNATRHKFNSVEELYPPLVS